MFEKLRDRETKLGVIGLGYVGLPLAVAFARKIDVIAFDISPQKIEQYTNGIDITKEVGNEAVKASSAFFTTDESYLKDVGFFIVAVPTPINNDKTPNLNPVESASIIVGRNLKQGSIVVFESTVYPGVTEDVCVSILEQESGLVCGVDFKVGYSPERINPGDKTHRLESITKVVSGMDEESLDIIAKTYELIIKAGIYKAQSIKVAEAAKVIENAQRDINIAFMNELSIIFNKMGIDTKSVLETAGTKWNFLNFSPGLVGGHCIGVDPYYLTYKAQQIGYHSQIILSGRRINDDMGKYIVENLVKEFIKADIPVKNARVAIFGFTFKENCPDTRNTRVIDIVNELREYGIAPVIADPVADVEEARHEYGIDFNSMDDIHSVNALVIAVGHEEFKQLTEADIEQYYDKDTSKILIDVKGILNRQDYEQAGYRYWRL